MYYVLISKSPIIYIFGEKEEILLSDYNFITENLEECGIPKDVVPVEYALLSPSEFSIFLDQEASDKDIYTFEDGELVSRKYNKAPYFYINPQDVYFEYPTYCFNPNTIKAALLTNEQLLPVISELVQEQFQDCLISVSPDPPVLEGSKLNDTVLAYVCIPVVMKKIPIGLETEEEHREIQEDSEF